MCRNFFDSVDIAVFSKFHRWICYGQYIIETRDFVFQNDHVARDQNDTGWHGRVEDHDMVTFHDRVVD